jgi:PAS domain S-box-containing protein
MTELKEILVVEDEGIIALNLMQVLTDFGYKVVQAVSSGEDAIRVAKELYPDLILMDIQLSGKMTGIEAAGIILKELDIPVVYLTAFSDNEQLQQAKSTRPYGYLIKPVQGTELRTTIEVVLYRHELDRKLRESEEKYRLLLQSANDAVFIHEMTPEGPGIFIEVNDRACEMLKYTREELLRMRPGDIDAVEEQEKIPDATNKLSAGKSARFTTVHVAKDGHRIPVDISINLVHLQGKQMLISIARDISERKRAEEALREVNKKLNLLSGITRHDIKNQLAALTGYLELSRLTLADPAKTEEYINKEKRVADAIFRQISFTKDYEDLGVKAPAWQNVAETVRKITRSLPIGKIRIDTGDPGLEIFADPLFEKVFYNLIDNALRYGEGKMTTIRISARETGQGLLITVEDDGTGIAAEMKQHLFRRGFGKNTGLGLFLSREILSITGMTITETGEPGKGAQFDITIPEGIYRFAEE